MGRGSYHELFIILELFIKNLLTYSLGIESRVNTHSSVRHLYFTSRTRHGLCAVPETFATRKTGERLVRLLRSEGRLGSVPGD